MVELLVLIPVLLLAIVAHEVAHAWVARREGDPTAEEAGRITLNPIPHLDFVGSLVVPAVLYALPGDFLFGWARPVPVNPARFRDPVRGDIRVSLAGVAVNFLLVGLFTLLLAALVAAGVAGPGVEAAGWAAPLELAALYGIFINLILAIFNLIPVPPLDGSHVVHHLLPAGLRERYRSFGRVGILALLALLFLAPQGFRIILWPVEGLMGLALAFVELWA